MSDKPERCPSCGARLFRPPKRMPSGDTLKVFRALVLELLPIRKTQGQLGLNDDQMVDYVLRFVRDGVVKILVRDLGNGELSARVEVHPCVNKCVRRSLQ